MAPAGYYKSEEFALRWHSKESATSIAKSLGISICTLSNAASKQGFPVKRVAERIRYRPKNASYVKVFGGVTLPAAPWEAAQAV